MSARRALEAAVRLVGIERTEFVIGKLLAATAIARFMRDNGNSDDLHEARHLYAAIKAGNSDNCEPGSCALDRKALDDWHEMEQARYDDPLGLGWSSTASTDPRA